MLKEEKEVVKKLSNFAPAKGKLFSGVMNNWHKYSINDIDYDKCRLIVYLFSELLECPIAHKPIEKVNWELYFTYKGIRGTFAHQKFGFRVYVDGSLAEDEANKISEEILVILKNTISSLGPILKIYAKKALQAGEIIVNNKLEEIELAYKYFRRETEKERIVPELTAKEVRELGLEKAMERIREARIIQKTNEYNEEAAYFTYISLIEHITVLFYAFNPTIGLSVTKFARKSWAEKFSLVFPMDDEQFSTFYEKLVNISNYRRNPNAHGHVTSKYTQAAFFFSETAHRIPISLYDNDVIYDVSIAEINLILLDEFLINIRNNSKTKNIMAYIDAGLDISFLKSDIIKYKLVKKFDEDDLTKYLEYENSKRDDAANMDW